MPHRTVLVMLIAIIIIDHSYASYHNIDEIITPTRFNHIHLGTYTHRPKLPPKVIHVTKTVAVKVPVPYPVKVPYHIPYPVPVTKPYPVQVPKYIKVIEHIHEPSSYDSKSNSDHHYDDSDQNKSSNDQYNDGVTSGGVDSSIVEYSNNGGGSGGDDTVATDQYIGYNHDINSEQQTHHNDDQYAGQYSAQQLIFSSPRFGINAYYTLPGTTASTNDNNSNQNGHSYRFAPTADLSQPQQYQQLNHNYFSGNYENNNGMASSSDHGYNQQEARVDQQMQQQNYAAYQNVYPPISTEEPHTSNV